MGRLEPVNDKFKIKKIVSLAVGPQMYCFSVLGGACWTLVERACAEAESAARREAALHVFLALADAAPYERAPPPLLALLQHALRAAAQPADAEPALLHTALDCLGT